MMNRNFAKLDENNKIIYAPDWVIRVDHHHEEWIDPETGEKHESDWDAERRELHPTADDYAHAKDGPWLPLDSTKPEKVGVYFVSTEYGDLVDGRIVRRYDERPIVAPPTVYIVEEIIYQLIAVGKLQAVKAVVGDYWELLTMRERIDATNPYWAEAFPKVCAGLIAAGVFASQDEIDALLAKCREGYMDEESGLEVR